MATLTDIAGLTDNEVEGITSYAKAVNKASGNAAEMLSEIMALSKTPKVPRPKFSVSQEKILLIQTGMRLVKIMIEGEIR